MTRDEAISILKNAAYLSTQTKYQAIEEAVDMAIEALRAQDVTDTNDGDMIYRQAAIDALDVLCQEHRYRIPGKRETYSQYNEAWQDALDRVESIIGNLPSAQPERTENTRKMRACDLIDRQAAINAILAVTGNSSVRELYEHVQEHGLSDMWSGGVNAAIDIIIAVPSAEPKTCEGCKHLGKWENEVEYGYPSPCTCCKRRVEDRYER